MRGLVWLLAGCLIQGSAKAGSNINPESSFAWGESIGWTNWRPDPVNGARVTEFFCSGFVYAANVGWIHLGDGSPENGVRYRNDSASDYGVNHDGRGNLQGLAYAANIGWINFETNGAPQIDLRTGRISGFAYSANAGWIELGESFSQLKLDSLEPSPDTDSDGLPDAWELTRSSSLITLSGPVDTDRDGQSDLEEYLADTDPLDPADLLHIGEFSLLPGGRQWRLSWRGQPTRAYRIQVRPSLSGESGWEDQLSFAPPGTQEWMSGLVDRKTFPDQSYFRVQAVLPLSR